MVLFDLPPPGRPGGQGRGGGSGRLLLGDFLLALNHALIHRELDLGEAKLARLGVEAGADHLALLAVVLLVGRRDGKLNRLHHRILLNAFLLGELADGLSERF